MADNIDGGSLNATNGHKLGTNEPFAKATACSAVGFRVLGLVSLPNMLMQQYANYPI